MAEVTKPTQKFVLVKEIENGVVYLQDGGMRELVMVNGINFELKSESEQGVILGGFQNFLDALDFPVQFFIHSRKVNIDAYLKNMEERKMKEENQLLKIQIEEYINFIRNFVEQNAIISKLFFVVIPYDPIKIETKGGLLGIFKKRPRGEELAGFAAKKQENLEQLHHRADQVIQGLGQIGLKAVPLEDEELIELFYNLYNPRLQDKRVSGLAAEK